MKKIVLYNPSITTLNVGDQIIFDSIERELSPILEGAFRVDVSTHLPMNKLFLRLLNNADYKFACGTNLLRNMQERFRQWDIGITNARKVGPAILVGVGWQKSKHPLTPYSKAVYQRVLSRDHIHSVRDEFTAEQLRKLGFNNVINTGCPTLWKMTPEYCSQLPEEKAEEVIFTLTDYRRDEQKDKLTVECLRQAYSKVYLWIQGYEDYDYAKDLGILDQVELIDPAVKAYDQVLSKNNVEYIGTRLHGGIRALQRGKRTMIIAVDGRALEKKKDIGLPVIDRNTMDKDQLINIIEKPRKTEMKIHQQEINKWKKYYNL